MSPTCAGTLLRGVKIVRNVGVSKAWIGRVTAAWAAAGEQREGERGARDDPADHATTSIWPIIDMSPCSAAWQWKT